MDTNAYLEIFLQEANENLEGLSQNLLDLEKDPESLDILNDIFRIAHTFKGMSATMGYNDIADLTHKMEDVLSLFKEGKIKVTANVVSVLFMCLDGLEKMVSNIEEGNNEKEDVSHIICKLGEISKDRNDDNDLSTSDNVVKKNEQKNLINSNIYLNDTEKYLIEEAEKINKDTYNIEVELAEDTILKSVRAFMIMQSLESMGDVIKTVPSTEDMEDEKFEFKLNFVVITDINEESLVEAVSNIAEVINVKVEKLNGLETSFILDNSKDIEDESVNQKNTSEIELTDKNEATSNNVETKKAENIRKDVKKSSGWVKVDLSRVDELMSLVSEVISQRTALEDYANGENDKNSILDIIENIKKTTTSLQYLVMKIRMLPLDTVFSRFPRMIRDLSLELDKNVEFIIEGADIELDRTIVNEISEPLVHLLRNSMDHGIESKDVRKKINKPEKATLRLSARSEGNNVFIEVSDDGGGLSYDKIKAKAEKIGIDTKGMDRKEVLGLIFNNGFSTNSDVTSISGRGVGMDAVKNKIETFGGSVDFITEEGKGTTFILKLPLSLQVFQGLIVKVNEKLFTIQESLIDTIMFFNEDNTRIMDGEVYFEYGDKVIPLIFLNEKLNLDNDGIGRDFKNKYNIIVKTGEKVYGVIVDDIVAQREIVVKPIPKSLNKLELFSGVSVLGNGMPILILDAAKFI